MLATTFGSAATEVQPSKKSATAVRGTATVADELSSAAVQPAAKPVWKKPIPMAVGGLVLASVIGATVYVSTKPSASVRPAQQQSQVAQQVPNAGSTQPETNAAPVTTQQTQPNQALSQQGNTQPPVPTPQVQPQAAAPQQTKPQVSNNEPPPQPSKPQSAQTQPAAAPPQQVAQQIQPAPVQQPAPAPAPPQVQQAPPQPAAAAPAAQPQPAPAAPAKPAPVVVAQPTVRLQVSERRKYSGPLSAGQMMSSAFLDANLQLQNHEVPTQVASEAAKGSALTLLLSINEDGRVYEGRVLAGDQQVGSAIVAAAKQSWQFDAPKVNGKSVKTTVSVAIQF
jgi:outer membrane biosynthesis protein TonB